MALCEPQSSNCSLRRADLRRARLRRPTNLDEALKASREACRQHAVWSSTESPRSIDKIVNEVMSDAPSSPRRVCGSRMVAFSATTQAGEAFRARTKNCEKKNGRATVTRSKSFSVLAVVSFGRGALRGAWWGGVSLPSFLFYNPLRSRALSLGCHGVVGLCFFIDIRSRSPHCSEWLLEQ